MPDASASTRQRRRSPAEKKGVPETDFYTIAWGLVCLSVCTGLDDKAATRRANAEHPTGISSRWAISKDKFFADDLTPNGAPCPDFPGHRHLLFNC